MISVSNEDILRQTAMVDAMYLEASVQPLMFTDFIRKVAKYHMKVEPFKPREIKVAKDYRYLIKGDLTPAKIIKFDQCPVVNGLPYWMGTTEKRLILYGFGFENGDSRYPSTVELNSIDNPHGYLAGVTGHGKSVVLNCLLMALMWLYPPWELIIYMSDAKVTEFMKYAGGNPPPHIRVISATGDPDYVLSMMNNMVKEMNAYNAVFANYGSKLSGFREETGLTVPRVLLVADEIQSTLMEAGIKESDIVEKLNLIARKGRSSGYHEFTGSQEVAASLNKVLGNVTLRASLGALPEVSTMVLGNDEARINYKKIGRLIVNLNHANKKKEENIHYRVPFISTPEFKEFKQILHDLGAQYNFKYPLSYYNSDEKYDDHGFRLRLQEDNPPLDQIMLGEPAFISNNKNSDYLRIELGTSEVSNSMLFGGSNEAIKRLIHIYKNNLEFKGANVISRAYCSSSDFTLKLQKKVGLDCEYSRSFSNDIIADLNEVHYRNIILESDRLVFSGSADETKGREMAKMLVLDEELTKDALVVRLPVLAQILTRPDNARALGIKDFEILEGETGSYPLRDELISLLERINLLSPTGGQVTVKDLRPLYIWIIGMESMLGLGIDKNSNMEDTLKKAALNAYTANCYLILTSKAGKGLGYLMSSIRYMLFDSFSDNDASNLGISKYPKDVPTSLEILYDQMADKKECVKFKAISFELEIDDEDM